LVKTIDFKEITLDSRQTIAPILKAAGSMREDCCFGTNYLWRAYYKITWAELGNCVVFRYAEAVPSFIFPVGGSDADKLDAVLQLKSFTSSCGHPLVFNSIGDDEKKLLEKAMPDVFFYIRQRDKYEYVYPVKRLLDLNETSDLRRKKKLIGEFTAAGDWHYEVLSTKNRQLCLQIENQWLREKVASPDADRELLIAEQGLIEDAMAHLEELELFGGILFQGKSPVAFSFGEAISGSTAVVHAEKALRVRGAFQLINQQFTEVNCNGFTHINREDDNDNPAIREVKLCYKPDPLLQIWKATEIK